MTRKSAKHIGGLCNGLNNELNRKSRWLIKKINRKLWQNHYMQIHDSSYDISGVYLEFKMVESVELPYRPPKTKVVDVLSIVHSVVDAAMINGDEKIKLHFNHFEDGVEYFMIYIPFTAYVED